MAIYRGPGGPGDATADQANTAQLALTYANQSAASASSAATSATNASNSASAASSSASTASTAATNAQTAETNAETAETNAETAQTAAEAARDASINLATNFTATATTLSPGSSATASYNSGTYTLTLGIPTGATGSTGATGAQGPEGLNWLGPYSGGTSYVIDDAVSYNGSSYICKLASTGNLPTNTTYWDIFAQQGAPGPGTGDVVGPSSAIDNTIARFDGTTGKLIQNSVVTVADTTGDISGVGQLNATTVDATNIEVTNIKAKDGSSAITIADSTGVVTVSSQLNVDNLNLSSNTISSSDTNGNIAITPNGTGEVDISKVDIDSGAIDGTTIGGASAAAGTFTTLTATTGNITTVNATTVDATNIEVTNIKANDGTASVALADTTGIATFSKATVIETTDNTNAALRITQLGTGNALLVEDSANPDASPVVIDAGGNVIIGNTTSTAGVATGTLQVQGTGVNGSSANFQAYSASTGGTLEFDRSRGALGVQSVVSSGDRLGRIFFSGSDGTAFIRGAEIYADVDGTPGTNDMPGRLVFSTTADGASSPTERMRITSVGNVGIATTAPAAKLHAAGNTILSNVDMLNASYDSVSFSVAGEETTPTGLFFSPDGTRMYVVGSNGDDVNQYSLSTPWVVSSATYVTVFSVSGQDAAPNGIFFRADGLKMYIVGQTNDTVYQYALTRPWTISTASYESISFSIASQETNPAGVFFKPDGLTMYVTGTIGDAVYQYTLSTAWNVSTATFTQSFSVSGQETSPQDLSFTGDGSRMFILGDAGNDVTVYNLTTPWDISTAATTGQFSVSGQETTPTGLYVKPDGTKFYMVGTTNDTVYQYTIPSIEINLTGTTNINGGATVAQDLTVDGRLITRGSEVLVGKTDTSLSIAGITMYPNGIVDITRSGGTCLGINRLTNDGTLVVFYQAGTAEGDISVSGTTVSYNGGHLSRWAQMPGTKDDTLVKGTVMSNLDEMNVYTDAEGNPVDNEQLNKVKVSDVEGDVNVAGVFVNWTHDDAHQVDEINMAMTGDMIIRIAQGVVVQKGDLLMSAGDGTAKPQGDDIVHSKTVAKVTSNHITCTYADGSYCVPCVLMAC